MTRHEDGGLSAASQPQIGTSVGLSQLLEKLEDFRHFSAGAPLKSRDCQEFYRSLVQDLRKARRPRAVIATCHMRLEAILRYGEPYAGNEWELHEVPKQLKNIIMHQELEIIKSYKMRLSNLVEVSSTKYGKPKEMYYHPEIASVLRAYRDHADVRLKLFSDDLRILQSHPEENQGLEGVIADLTSVRRLAQHDIARPAWQQQRKEEWTRVVETTRRDTTQNWGAAGATAVGSATANVTAAGPAARTLAVDTNVFSRIVAEQKRAAMENVYEDQVRAPRGPNQAGGQIGGAAGGTSAAAGAPCC